MNDSTGSSGVMALPPIYSDGDEPGVALVRHVAEQLEQAGLPRHGENKERLYTGLVNPEAFGDTGFSVKEISPRELEFHIVISGKSAGVEYNEWTDWQAGYGTMHAYEPLNQKTLHGPIREAFREMGFEVKRVKNDSYEKYGNDDVTYIVVTDYPEILKIAPSGDSSRNKDDVSRQWDNFFDSLQPQKKF